MSAVDRLFVIWTDAEGRRHVIGELWRETSTNFAFGYRVELLPEAEAVGFRLLPEFPQRRGLDAPYHSTTLFPTFKKRIPSASRADYAKLLENWGAEGDDPFEILLRSGGVQLTDRLELAEHRPPDDDLRRPLSFRLSGARFSEASGHLEAGDELVLVREPKNPVDDDATTLFSRAGGQVGWVPRQYSRLIARMLDRGESLRAIAERRLLLPDTRDRWVVRVERATGQQPPSISVPPDPRSLH